MFYLVNYRVKRLAKSWTEAELYACDIGYSGATILEFTDGLLVPESDCFELSMPALLLCLELLKLHICSMIKVDRADSTKDESFDLFE